ncbi:MULTISPECIES: galactitol-1-phosphate 5-dehydrogenase [Priestia]|jgi:L-iditol 2-dehydrogenase|uniref:Galactitol-1-phosphate 5-dehydrogenase n=3 Tax=Priestia TaxID=2800373 RepID=D5DYA4_PRIM1|nr:MULTISPECIES: galactitol-1-phosphate 5-dehydrogenase [Priestia]KOP75316.1 alcohol dehydrogenase [Bacillus sp. FJAT-21351]KQU16748.1 alcohol dehydrogenase [Bacillus sp. Leaf75]MBZ5480613.1 galactitol-1-phosphate 5-dehydrogenase [Bacillus sp. T_4]MDH6653799.1 L-iditol 2-dehydrogenase [Bacillus sp. PvP124]MDP9576088.1 L-iditol 2-dehydrogenase [Bacillus sp. 1751]
MKAAVLHEKNKIIYQDIGIDSCRANEVKIKVMAAGICGSDTHKMTSRWKYPLPAIMGHEFAGYIVEKGGKVVDLNVGDRVAAIPFKPCSACEYCQKGQYSLCENYGMIGAQSFGGFAQYVNIPASNVIQVGEMDFEEAAMIEPLAVALHGVLNIHPQIGDTAAVFGAGVIGMLTIQWLKIAGVKEIIAIDISSEKLAEARAMGCEKVIHARYENVLEKINDYTKGRGVDLALECAGSPVTQEQCLLVTRKKGKVGYLGIAYSDVCLSEAAFESIFRKELTLQGFWNSYSAPFPGKEWKTSVDFILNRKIRLKELISHRFKLEDTQKAFNMIINREEAYGKVLIIPNKE